MANSNIDVIILSYAKTNYFKFLTQQAIDSLIASKNKFELRIIVVESNKSLGNYQYPNTTTLYPKSSFGYNRYINYALKYTSADLICIANNDLIFNKNWLSEIVNAFNNDSSLKSLSPICPDNHIKYGFSVNSGIFKGYRIAIEMAGWCIVFKRELLKFKLFDNNLKFWYCDNDYANVLKLNKINHALVTSSVVNHLESRTLKSETGERKNALTLREFIYYDYKWNHKNILKYLYRRWRYDYLVFQKVTNFTAKIIGK